MSWIRGISNPQAMLRREFRTSDVSVTWMGSWVDDAGDAEGFWGRVKRVLNHPEESLRAREWTRKEMPS